MSEISYSNPPPTEDASSSKLVVPNPNKKRQERCIQTKESSTMINFSNEMCNKNDSGMIPVMSHSTTTTASTTVRLNQQPRQNNFKQPVISTPKKSKTSIPAPIIGQLSHISQAKNDLPLLQSEQSQLHSQNITFETMYPDFARNLNSMKHQHAPAVTSSTTSASPVSLKMTDFKGPRPLLLKIPDMQIVSQLTQPYYRPPVIPLPQKFTSQSNVSSSYPPQPLRGPHPSHSTQLPHGPLPSSHPPPHTSHHLTHVVQPPHEHPAPNPSLSSQPQHRFAPQSSDPHPPCYCPPRSMPLQHQCPPYQLPMFTNSSTTNNKPPLLSIPVQPTFKPIVLPSIPPTRPQVPVGQPNQQLPSTFPNMPLMPFVPILLPQPEKCVVPKKVSPPLLQVNDPIHSKKQNGLKLLKISNVEPPKLVNSPKIHMQTNGLSSVVQGMSLEQSHNPLEHSEGISQCSTTTSKPDASVHSDVKIQKRLKPKKPKVAWTKEIGTPTVREPVSPKQTDEPTMHAAVLSDLSENSDCVQGSIVSEVQVKNHEQSFGIPLQQETFPKTLEYTVCEQDEVVEPQHVNPVLEKPYYPDDIPHQSLAIRRLNLQSQFNHSLSTTSSTTTVVSDISNITPSTEDKSNTDVTLGLSQNSPVVELFSPSVHSSLSTLSTLSTPKNKALKLHRPDVTVASEVYHPPVLALNLDKPINQDLLSVSTLSSMSATFTITPDSTPVATKVSHGIQQTSHDNKHNANSPATLTDNESNDLSHQRTPMKHFDHLFTLDKHTPFEKIGLLPRPHRSTDDSTALQRLQVLEDQLNAIESTVKTVQGEFKSSKQVMQLNVL